MSARLGDEFIHPVTVTVVDASSGQAVENWSDDAGADELVQLRYACAGDCLDRYVLTLTPNLAAEHSPLRFDLEVDVQATFDLDVDASPPPGASASVLIEP